MVLLIKEKQQYLWNKKTGKPIYKAIVWQDRRTANYCNKLKLKNKDKIIQKITGLVLDPYFSATKINWILKNIPKKNKIKLKIFYLELLILGYYGNLLKVDHIYRYYKCFKNNDL